VLGTKSTEVNSLYFTILSIDWAIFNFLCSDLSFKTVFAPRFVAKNNSFGQRSRNRKKLPVPIANQIAGNEKNITMHAQIKK
jgi:hypothetical protein